MREHVFVIQRHQDGRAWEQEYHVALEPTDRLLDGLVRIKDTLDGTLTFRRSCAHGICGSCAVNVGGSNMLACQALMRGLPGRVNVGPLPGLPVVRDLVVDWEPFFALTEAVMPYLVADEPPPERERLQSPGEQARILASITCIMCASCTTSCPGFWADPASLGPAALVKAYRFIFDSRDRAGDERLRRVAHERGLWRCHSAMNCADACPKEIDIPAHIAALKRLAVRRAW